LGHKGARTVDVARHGEIDAALGSALGGNEGAAGVLAVLIDRIVVGVLTHKDNGLQGWGGHIWDEFKDDQGSGAGQGLFLCQG
jgi:3-deoxy-D-arabino-heptulosonate 7-phosphate (DAHP) synthase